MPMVYVVLPWVGRGTRISRSPVQLVLPKCLNGFIDAVVNPESEETTEPGT